MHIPAPRQFFPLHNTVKGGGPKSGIHSNLKIQTNIQHQIQSRLQRCFHGVSETEKQSSFLVFSLQQLGPSPTTQLRTWMGNVREPPFNHAKRHVDAAAAADDDVQPRRHDALDVALCKPIVATAARTRGALLQAGHLQRTHAGS